MVRSIKKMCRDEFGIRKRDKWNKLLVFILLYYVILFFNGSPNYSNLDWYNEVITYHNSTSPPLSGILMYL